jgi:hypothetical protein
MEHSHDSILFDCKTGRPIPVVNIDGRDYYVVPINQQLGQLLEQTLRRARQSGNTE